jgi:hypothetical protein
MWLGGNGPYGVHSAFALLTPTHPLERRAWVPNEMAPPQFKNLHHASKFVAAAAASFLDVLNFLFSGQSDTK